MLCPPFFYWNSVKQRLELQMHSFLYNSNMVKSKKKKAKKKKLQKVSTIRHRLHRLWSNAVRERASEKCELCGIAKGEINKNEKVKTFQNH